VFKNHQSLLLRTGAGRRFNIFRADRGSPWRGMARIVPVDAFGGFGDFSLTLLIRNSRPATNTFCSNLNICFGMPPGKSTKL